MLRYAVTNTVLGVYVLFVLWYAILCYTMLCAMLGYAMLRNTNAKSALSVFLVTVEITSTSSSQSIYSNHSNPIPYP